MSLLSRTSHEHQREFQNWLTGNNPALEEYANVHLGGGSSDDEGPMSDVGLRGPAVRAPNLELAKKRLDAAIFTGQDEEVRGLIFFFSCCCARAR